MSDRSQGQDGEVIHVLTTVSSDVQKVKHVVDKFGERTQHLHLLTVVEKALWTSVKSLIQMLVLRAMSQYVVSYFYGTSQ